MRIRRKLVWGLPLIIGLAVFLVHTRPVESRVLDFVSQKLRDRGFELQAARLQINLFRLSASLDELSLRGPGLEAQIDHVAVNGRRALFSGVISFDSLLVRDGTIVLRLPVEGPAQTSEAGGDLPRIFLGEAHLENLTLHYQDRKAQIDTAAKDIVIDYSNRNLVGSLATIPFEAGGRAIPQFKVGFSAKTRDFLSFENVQFRMESAESKLELRGRIRSTLQPELRIELAVGGDLLPELPGVSISGDLSPREVDLRARAAYSWREREFPFSLQTRFDYTAAPMVIPVEIQLDTLLAGNLNLLLENGNLEGALKLDADPEEIERRFPSPYMDLSTASLAAEFRLPELDPSRLQADAELDLTGLPSLSMTARWNQGALELSGSGIPLQSAYLSFDGVYSDRLSLNFQGGLPHMDPLEAFVQLPEGVCAGPIGFSGEIKGTPEDWRVDHLWLILEDAGLAPYFRDTVLVSVDGGPKKLRGKIFSDALNPRDALAAFELDTTNQEWRTLSLDIDSQPLPYEGRRARLQLQAQGHGALATPEMRGQLGLEIHNTERTALLESPFHWLDRSLDLPLAHIQTAHGEARGRIQATLEPELDWEVDLAVETRPNPNFEPLIEHRLPKLQMSLKGNQTRLAAEIDLPDQVYQLADFEIPLAAQTPVKLNIFPREPSITGSLDQAGVMGIGISSLHFSYGQDRLSADADFRLADFETLTRYLAAYWPADLSLGALEGKFRLNADSAFENPEYEVFLTNASGSFQDAPFSLGMANLRFADDLSVEPFDMSFAGNAIQVSQASPDAFPQRWAEPPSPEAFQRPLRLDARINLSDSPALRSLAGAALPSELSFEPLTAHVRLLSDFDLREPYFGLTIDKLDARYEANSIEGRGIGLVYDGGIKLKPTELLVAGLPVRVSKAPNHYRIDLQPSADDLGRWVQGLAGNAVFDVALLWGDPASEAAITGSVTQKSGRLVFLDPWLELTDWTMAFSMDHEGLLLLQKANGSVNEGNLEVTGKVLPLNPFQTASLDIFAEGVQLDLDTALIQVTSFLEFRAGEAESSVQGSVQINQGYYFPELEIRGLVQDLISTVPELYFPDPDLERTKLLINVITEKPIIVENPNAYMEVETPSLVIRGNLAEPTPFSGPLNINEGSSLTLGNQSFIFNPSQIQFHPNRQDDPYLQVSLQSADATNRNTININGYLSDLDYDLDSSDMASILGSYLFSRVSSLVSFEGEISNTIFNNSFTFIVSKPLTRKVVTRYAYPLVEQNQRYELILGPYRGNFLNLIQDEEILSAVLKHSRRFGYPNGQRPRKVRNVSFGPENPPKWVRKRFKIKRDDLFSETRWRRAELDLRRQLKERGYLTPTISHSYEDDKLSVDLDLGPQIDLKVTGLETSEKDRRAILGRLRSTDGAGLKHIERTVERLALAKGYPSAAAFATRREETLSVHVLLGRQVGEVSFHFGKAQPLLGDLYKSKKAREQLINRVITDWETVEAQLRARLAAKGYLQPTIEPGGFRDLNHYDMPIDPGPRAKVSAILENGVPLKNRLVGEPFHYEIIAQLAEQLRGHRDSTFQVNIRPERNGPDIILNVSRKELREQRIATLEVEGAARIREKTILRFLGFEPNMGQEALIKAQRRLIEAGPFRLARLQGSGANMVLEVAEHNRWDGDFQVTWNENQELGYGLQFKDHQLFRGFNDLALGFLENNEERTGLSRLRFQRVRGLPIDVSLGLELSLLKIDPNPRQLTDMFGIIEVITQTPEKRELNLELAYHLSEHQQLNAGLAFQKNIVNTTSQFFDPFRSDSEDPLSPENFEFEFSSAPEADINSLRASWLYRNLDRRADPTNGLLASFGAEYSPTWLGTLDEFEGLRLTGKLNAFKAWGSLFWRQRLEAGILTTDPSPELELDRLFDPILFVLGGPNSIRGFDVNFVGPLADPFLTAKEEAEPLGGNAYAFFSEELTFETPYFGMGFSPFVDGGWVWADYRDWLSSGLVVTGGLGISFDTPAGYFRLDWARPIVDQPFEKELEDFLFPEDREAARREALKEFSFRFGKVF